MKVQPIPQRELQDKEDDMTVRISNHAATLAPQHPGLQQTLQQAAHETIDETTRQGSAGKPGKRKLADETMVSTISRLNAKDTTYSVPEASKSINSDTRIEMHNPANQPEAVADMRSALLHEVLGIAHGREMTPGVAKLVSTPGNSLALQQHLNGVALDMVRHGIRQEELPAIINHMWLSNLCTQLTQGLVGGVGFNAGQSLVDYVAYVLSKITGRKLDQYQSAASIGAFIGGTLGAANLLNEAVTSGYPSLKLKYGEGAEVDKSLAPFQDEFKVGIGKTAAAVGAAIALPMTLKNVFKAIFETQIDKHLPASEYGTTALKTATDAAGGLVAGSFIGLTMERLTGQNATELPRILLAKDASEQLKYAYDNFTAPEIPPQKYAARVVDQSCRGMAAMLFNSIGSALPPFVNKLAMNALSAVVGVPERDALSLDQLDSWIPSAVKALVSMRTPVQMALVAGYGMSLLVSGAAVKNYCERNNFSVKETEAMSQAVKILLAFYFYVAIGTGSTLASAANASFKASVQKLWSHLREGEAVTKPEEEAAEYFNAEDGSAVIDDEYFDALDALDAPHAPASPADQLAARNT